MWLLSTSSPCHLIEGFPIVSPRPAPGRRRAPKPTLRARVAKTLSPQLAVKSVAAFGLVGAATAAVIVPASGQASVAAVSQSTTDASKDGLGAALLQARGSALTAASRGSERAALGSLDGSGNALAAPGAAAPVAAESVGISGFAAVAKPPTETNLDKVPGAAAAAGAAAPAASTTTSTVYVGEGYSASAFAGWCSGLGLSPNAIGVCSAARSLFGITSIGGFRAGDWGDHGSGRAVDVMTSSFGQGDAVAEFFQAHAGEFGIKYIIWKQRYWAPGGGWSMMEDRGSPTQNHMDHVHISVN